MNLEDDLDDAFEHLRSGIESGEIVGFIIVGVPPAHTPELEYSEVNLPTEAPVSLAIAGLEMVKHRLLSACTNEYPVH